MCGKKILLADLLLNIKTLKWITIPEPLILHSFISKSTVLSSSLIQTILSAPESHQIIPLGSRALPPVGNLTLP